MQLYFVAVVVGAIINGHFPLFSGSSKRFGASEKLVFHSQ